MNHLKSFQKESPIGPFRDVQIRATSFQRNMNKDDDTGKDEITKDAPDKLGFKFGDYSLNHF